MGIVGTIEGKYPVNLGFPRLDDEARFGIRLGKGFRNGEKEKIEEELERLGLSCGSTGVAEMAEICMDACPGEKNRCLTLHWEGKSFYFVEGEKYEALAWTLYGLAKGMRFDDRITAARLRLYVYSASQQKLAVDLLKTLHFWQGDANVEELGEIFSAAISNNVSALISPAPRFSLRPIVEDGMKMIRESASLFSKKKTMRLDELAKKLYGQTDMKEELEAYCQLICSSPAFGDARRAAVKSVMERVYRLPVTGLCTKLRDAAAKIKEGLSKAQKDAQKKAAKALEEKVGFRVLDSERLSGIYEEPDSEYNEMTKKMIEAKLLEAVAEQVIEQTQAAFKEVRPLIAQWQRELNNFCKTESGEKLDMDWRCLTEQDERLRAGSHGWGNDLLRSLVTNAGVRNGYNLQAWFYGGDSFDRLGDGFYATRFKVPGLSGDLAIALMISTL